VPSPALHELDPVFRRATLQNEKLRSLVRDLRFHHDPAGTCAAETLTCDYELVPVLTEIPSSALQSMVITKQPQIGGKGTVCDGQI
jgi:phytanoyl-CoA hydroxylase